MGVFSICSPVRPNPIGLSVLEVIEREGSRIHVKGIDMINGTPILDIKPYVVSKHDCPSCGPFAKRPLAPDFGDRLKF